MNDIAEPDETELPRLLSAKPQPPRKWLSRLFNFLGEWREHIFFEWLYSAESGLDDSAMAKSIDGLISFVLLLNFIRERDKSTLPPFEEIVDGLDNPTLQLIARTAQQATADAVLKAVLAPSMPESQIAIPRSILRLSLAESIKDAINQIYGSQAPVTLFGDFHQLCLAHPLSRKLRFVGNTKKAKTQRYDKGIHYTPPSIVDYLVCRVLEEAFHGLSREQVTKLRILDPSCGCGAFLIAVVRFVMRWLERTAKSSNELEVKGKTTAGKVPKGVSLQTRFALLKSMIFGIDIDRLATEWTVRLLLLTIWEFSAQEPSSRNSRPSLAVPDLSHNVISADFLDTNVFGPEAESTGFIRDVDVVIGGPPFVRLQQLYKTEPDRIETYREQFVSTKTGQFDLYMPFVEKSINILSDGGILGFSVSSTFLRSDSGRALRSFIARKASILEIVEFEDPKIYPDAVTQIALLTLQKRIEATSVRHTWIKGKGNLREKLSLLRSATARENRLVEVRILPLAACRSENWSFTTEKEKILISQMESSGVPLDNLAITTCQGVDTGADDIFLLQPTFYEPPIVVTEQRHTRKAIELEAEAVRPIVRGRDIQGYHTPEPRTLCIFPYDEKGEILDEDLFSNRFPLAYSYLESHHLRLAQRKLRKHAPWYALRGMKAENDPSQPKLVAGAIDSGCGFMYDAAGQFLCHSSTVSIHLEDERIDPYYLLGVLNSQVFWEFICHRTPTMGSGRHVYRINALRRFPVVLPESKVEHQLVQEISQVARQLMESNSNLIHQQNIQNPLEKSVRRLYHLEEV